MSLTFIASLCWLVLTKPFSPVEASYSSGKQVTGGSAADDGPEGRSSCRIVVLLATGDMREERDPSDYMLENKKGETVGKMPGTLSGSDFIIQNCEDCNIYVFDHTTQVTIDDCINCRIFLGPIHGSVFIRDCKDCKLMAACQQFRSRDCQKIDTFVACVSQPIIESSTGMKFGCFQYHYPELEDQFKSSGMSVYNNNWSGIHDFTPVPEQSNFSLIPKDCKIEDYIPLPTEEPFSTVKISTEADLSVVPRTLGRKRKSSNESCLVVFFSDGHSHQRAKNFINGMKTNHAACDLVQSKEMTLEPSDAHRIFGSENFARIVHDGPVIGLEYNGEGAVQACQDTLASVSEGATGAVFASSSRQVAAQQVDNFYNYADMQMNA